MDDDEDERERLAFGANKVGTLKQKKAATNGAARNNDEDFDNDDLDNIKLGDGDDADDGPVSNNGTQPKKTKTVADYLKKKRYQQMARGGEGDNKACF